MDYRVTYTADKAQGSFWIENCLSLKDAEATVERIKKSFEKEFNQTYTFKIKEVEPIFKKANK